MSSYWVIDRLDPLTHLADLQRLRSQRTPSLKVASRKAAYTVGLAQAEDLWAAAESVEPLASPILRYYSVAQAAQALAAASPLSNDEWQPGHSHGLICKVAAPGHGARLDFSKVFISPAGEGLAQVLAAALGSSMIPENTKLSDLIGSLWHNVYTCEEPLEDLNPRRPLQVWPSGARDDQGRLKIDIPGDFKTAANTNMLDLKQFLMGYPGLSGCPTSNLTWRAHVDGEAFVWIDVEASSSFSNPETWLEHCDVGPNPGWLARISGTTQSVGPLTFLPGFNGDDHTIHPLLSWFLVLYGFSMLARYYGRLWRARLDLDVDVDAVDLRDLIAAQSADAICLVTQGLRTFLAAPAMTPSTQ